MCVFVRVCVGGPLPQPDRRGPWDHPRATFRSACAYSMLDDVKSQLSGKGRSCRVFWRKSQQKQELNRKKCKAAVWALSFSTDVVLLYFTFFFFFSKPIDRHPFFAFSRWPTTHTEDIY